MARQPLEVVRDKLAAISDWTAENVHHAIQATADELEVGMGKVGMPLRVAVTGAGQSPALDVTVHAIGKSRSVDRINKALAFIAEREGRRPDGDAAETTAGYPAVFVCYSGLAMPRRARKPLIPSRASRSRSCSCSAGVISCRVSVICRQIASAFDRYALVIPQMIVGKQMASGRDVGQKLAYRLVDNHQSRSPL